MSASALAGLWTELSAHQQAEAAGHAQTMAAAWLLNDRSSYVTGVVVPVTGGAHA